MIRELEKGDFEAIGFGFGLRIQFPEARAVIEGNNPGWVFVDDPARADTALVWAQGIQGFYLAGEQNNSPFLEHLNTFIDRVVAPRLGELGLGWFEVSGGKDWDPVIEGVFANRGLEQGLQLVYTLDPQKLQPGSPSATDQRVRKIDRDLLQDARLKNRDFLLSKITSFWEQPDNFLGLGLGYALVDEDEVVSACISGFVSRAIHVIDIETIEEHWGKGYALAVGRHFVAACMLHRLKPYWDCMVENIPSARLAEKLGFMKTGEYTLYSFKLGSGGR